MRWQISLFVAVSIIFGCVSVSEREKRSLNARIVYRNLAPKQEHIIKRRSINKKRSTNLKPIVSKKSKSVEEEKSPVPKAPRYFIGFGSKTDFDEIALKRFTKFTPTKAEIMVVGYAHGSGKDNLPLSKLAVKRADIIYKYLLKHGYENIYFMASWGREVGKFTPSKGVHLFVIKKDQRGD